MKNLAKRLGALEASQAVSVTGRVDLDALTDAELDRLEEIVTKLEGGQSIESLSDCDLMFVAALKVIL